MSLIYFDGLTDCVTVPKPEWVSSNPFSNSVTGRDGSANGAGTSPSNNRSLYLPSALTTCIIGFATTVGANQFNSVGMYGWHNAAGVAMWMGVTTSGMLEFRRSNSPLTSVIATSTGHPGIVTGTWHYIEVKYVPSTTSGSLVVKLDGQEVINVSGVATAVANGAITTFSLNTNSNFGGGQWSFDDLYVLDATDGTATQGRAFNDFLGDVRVVNVVPSAAGDSTGWTPSTGANWAAVDEIPAVTTDYVSAVASATGTRDLYQLTDLPTAVESVYALRAGVYSQKSDAGYAMAKLVLKTGGTVSDASATQYLSSGNWLSRWGTILPQKPGSTVFTPADVNALQVGLEVVSS